MKSCHVMLPGHVGKGGLWLSHLAMSEVRNSQVYSSHHWPLRWPSTHDERDGPVLIPFDSGLSTHSKPLGHDFANQKNGPQCSVLFSTVLCRDMEHGAQMSVTLCCLLQQKTKGSFTAFRRRRTKANLCIRISGCSASNQRPAKRLVTEWSCFSQCLVVT